ncbi:protein C2-DOMAIN ABA-RELATED 7-like [Amaranthus tricolor]|uniref:protein C2-DOMAIN ABA-RELATED 7-like n=1 Tax=Amaranthus tricolor TaxID=29722 RepID=UPI00258FC1FF|nr:protein C2-DOMAIN ABA-RELATED 7-like [Amaranthus tricolor]
MANVIGLLKIRVIKGINLVVKDANSSDPYVIVSMGSQKLKTRHVKNDCNPEWNDELTLAIYDVDAPINLIVYDKDTFTADDEMGEASIDIKPYVECLKANLGDLPSGTVIDKIFPSRDNCLADVSKIIWKDGKLVQDMILRLKKAETGEVEIQIEWVKVPGSGF